MYGELTGSWQKFRKLQEGVGTNSKGRLKKLWLLAVMSVTLVVFWKYADTQSTFHISYTGQQVRFINNYHNISGQITRRGYTSWLNYSYAAFNDSTHAFTDSPTTFKDSPVVLQDSAGLLKPLKAPVKGMKPVNLPMQFLNPSFTKNLDLMKVKPFKFLPEYKNPCWKTPGSRIPISCLPYFYLVGAPKSGTTDVYNRLQAHPDFTTPRQKEPHWITRRRFGSMIQSSIQHYIDYFFSKPAIQIYKFKDNTNYHWKITGDCSASTFFDNYKWRRLAYHNSSSEEEPVLTNADFIHHLNPDVRIIVILREPVDRLYSDFLFFNSRHDSQEDFHVAVTKALAWFSQCRQTRSLRSCVYDEKGNSLPARLLIGIYHIHLKEFFRVFPREQVLVVKLEEYSKDPASAMDNIFRFLDLSESAKLRKDTNSTKHANPRRKADKMKGGMWARTRSLLQDFHRPHNEELLKLMNDETFNFNAMYS